MAVRGSAGLITALLGVALAGCGHRAAAASEPQSVAIAVEPAQAAPAVSLYEGTCTVAAPRTYRLAFEVPGRVLAIGAQVGDRVSAGRVLARLEDAEYAQQLEAASAQARAGRANARKALNGSRDEDRRAAAAAVAGAQAQVAVADAERVLAQRDRARVEQLYAEGAVAAQARDAAVADGQAALERERAAQAQLGSAVARQREVDEGVRTEDRAAALAQAQAADAAVALARTTLAKTVLVAPADGYVQERAIDVGSDAQPGATAFVLVGAQAPEVACNVPEERAGGIGAGMRVSVTGGAGTLAGWVRWIEPAADPVTRTVEVRVRVPGMRGNVGGVVTAAIGQERDGGASVPLGAVITEPGGGARVEIYDRAHDTVLARNVRIVRISGERAVIGGVRIGEPVVTAGAYEAHPGDRVRVVDGEGRS